jgi:hypothetical protein
VSGSTYAKLRQAGRDERGRKLYRLGYFFTGSANEFVWSHETWTLDRLISAGVKFLQRRPAARMVTL